MGKEGEGEEEGNCFARQEGKEEEGDRVLEEQVRVALEGQRGQELPPREPRRYCRQRAGCPPVGGRERRNRLMRWLLTLVAYPRKDLARTAPPTHIQVSHISPLASAHHLW